MASKKSSEPLAVLHPASVEAVEARTDTKILGMGAELRQEIAEFRQETRDEFASVRQEMRDEFASVRQEMRDEFAVVRQEIRELDAKNELRLSQMRTWLLLTGGSILAAVAGMLFWATSILQAAFN